MESPVTFELDVRAEERTARVYLSVNVQKGDEQSALKAIEVAFREAAFRLGFSTKGPEDE